MWIAAGARHLSNDPERLHCFWRQGLALPLKFGVFVRRFLVLVANQDSLKVQSSARFCSLEFEPTNSPLRGDKRRNRGNRNASDGLAANSMRS